MTTKTPPSKKEFGFFSEHSFYRCKQSIHSRIGGRSPSCIHMYEFLNEKGDIIGKTGVTHVRKSKEMDLDVEYDDMKFVGRVGKYISSY